MKSSHFLHANWTLQPAGDLPADVPDAVRRQPVPATVPGCVHTDLLAAGLIPDPYRDYNEKDLQWIGYTDWRFSNTFDLDARLLEHERIELVCEGLDTIARLELNGESIGRAENMHLGYRFDVKPLLEPGPNRLAITFESAVRYAQALYEETGRLPYANTYPYPYNVIRKMACNFGWDWGPQLVTAGIWQPIALQAWDTARIAAVRPLVMRAGPGRAELRVITELARTADAPVTLRAILYAPGGALVAETVAATTDAHLALTLAIDQPERWWPVGYGEQPLYRLVVEAAAGDGEPLDRWEGHVGLRTVRLNTAPDEIGSQFVIEINGQPVFCKGANWIPDDCFPTRVDEARYRRRIQQAVDANMNMLRIWGGGIYETGAFYRLCDELGVMVWQDFLFACAAYPETPELTALVETEARYQVTRLSQHPSLVLWNGNNENIWGYFDWGWQEKVGDRAWGLGYYLDLLPRVVAELDPSRPYWPASPYSGSMDIHPNANEHGNRHVWDVWFGDHFHTYRRHTPRFTSEFGFQAPATYATLHEVMAADQLEPGSPGLDHRQRCPQGNANNQRHLEVSFEDPGNFDDWHYLQQVNQARALAFGVEWFRSLQPHCMGTLYWQLNDCWPGVTWAAVDGAGRLKPLWYATRRFFAPRLLTWQPAGDEELALVAVNDTGQPWRATARLRRLRFDGITLAEISADFAVPARGRAQVVAAGAEVVTPGDPAGELLCAEAGSARALHFFDVDKRLAYPAPAFDAVLTRTGSTHKLAITARSLLRDVVIMVDRLDPAATISDQGVTLLPGERVSFTIQSDQDLDREALIRPPVFQCTNRFGRPHS